MSLISASQRDAVVRRARSRCEYCHLAQDSQVATFPIDHVLPLVLGGLTELSNLALACPRCNAAKWKHAEALDPESGELLPLYNPRTQQWNDHFRWSDADSTIIEALSAVGRTTLALLDLNSTQHRTIRALLRALELHPPAHDS